jgi:hypothetical protein
LNGSVEDQETMQRSVKLLLTPPDANTSAPHPESHVQQFSGGQTYSPGQPAPPVPQIVPPSPQHFQASASIQSGLPINPISIIFPEHSPAVSQPPKWNYTATPKNGIMIWQSGYGTSRLPQRSILSTLSNLRPNTQGSGQQTPLQLLNTRSKLLSPQAWSMPELRATQFVLPEMHAVAPVSWDEWYRRVARAIYDLWKQSSVGPGKATVLINVWNTHNVDCKIVDFSPALDTKRDAQAEEQYREAIVHAVTAFDGANLWEFPIAAVRPKRIAFDMEFTHAVGESPGCTVVHMHNNKALSSSDNK